MTDWSPEVQARLKAETEPIGNWGAGAPHSIKRKADIDAVLREVERLELLQQTEHVHTLEAKLAEALARVERVLALHQRDRVWCRTCGSDTDPVTWPCPTVRALNGEEP